MPPTVPFATQNPVSLNYYILKKQNYYRRISKVFWKIFLVLLFFAVTVAIGFMYRKNRHK